MADPPSLLIVPPRVALMEEMLELTGETACCDQAGTTAAQKKKALKTLRKSSQGNPTAMENMMRDGSQRDLSSYKNYRK